LTWAQLRMGEMERLTGNFVVGVMVDAECGDMLILLQDSVIIYIINVT